MRAKFSEYAVLGYSGAGVVVDKHPLLCTISRSAIAWRMAAKERGTARRSHRPNLVARVPDAVPFEHACFATLGSIALNAVRIAIELGDSGRRDRPGTGRSVGAQLARLQGGVVIAIDLRPRSR